MACCNILFLRYLCSKKSTLEENSRNSPHKMMPSILSVFILNCWGFSLKLCILCLKVTLRNSMEAEGSRHLWLLKMDCSCNAIYNSIKSLYSAWMSNPVCTDLELSFIEHWNFLLTQLGYVIPLLLHSR